MRNAALQETALQIAMRNCFKEVMGKGSIYVILAKQEYMEPSTYYFVECFCWSHEVSAGQEKQSSP